LLNRNKLFATFDLICDCITALGRFRTRCTNAEQI